MGVRQWGWGGSSGRLGGVLGSCGGPAGVPLALNGPLWYVGTLSGAGGGIRVGFGGLLMALWGSLWGLEALGGGGGSLQSLGVFSVISGAALSGAGDPLYGIWGRGVLCGAGGPPGVSVFSGGPRGRSVPLRGHLYGIWGSSLWYLGVCVISGGPRGRSVPLGSHLCGIWGVSVVPRGPRGRSVPLGDHLYGTWGSLWCLGVPGAAPYCQSFLSMVSGGSWGSSMGQRGSPGGRRCCVRGVGGGLSL